MALEPPRPECSTEELRVWTIQAVAGIGVDANNVIVSVATQLDVVNQSIDGLRKEPATAKSDVGVFDAIKRFVAEAQLETRTEAIYADLKSTQAQTHDFAKHLEGYLARTEAV